MAAAKKTDGVERAPDRLNIQGTKPPIFYVALAEKILSDREELHIHALGSCIEAAVGAADRLSSNGLATVTKIRTDKGGRSNATAQIVITVKRAANFNDLYEKQKKDRESRAGEHEARVAAAEKEAPKKEKKSKKKVEDKKTPASEKVDAVRATLTEQTKPGVHTEKDELAETAQKVTEARYALYAAEKRVYPTVYPPPPAGDGGDVFDAADEAGEGIVTYKEMSKYLSRNQNLSLRLGKVSFQKFSDNFSIENLEDCPKATFMEMWQKAAANRED